MVDNIHEANAHPHSHQAKKSGSRLLLPYVILLNISLIVLRVTVGEETTFQGNLFSTIMFFVILLSLAVFFFMRSFDNYIITWLSFYFACPIIKIPNVPIGSLGLLNGLFIPLMLLFSFDFDYRDILSGFRHKFKDMVAGLKNKYFIVIILLYITSALNAANVPIRSLLSSAFGFTAPLIFACFVFKRAKDIKRIIGYALYVAVINLFLSIYEILFKPEWAIFTDWRDRIMGNFFHPNNYFMFLIPLILILYSFIRKKFSWYYLILMLSFLGVSLFAYSRIGIVSVLAGLLLYEFLFKEGFRFTIKKASLVVVIIILGYVLTNVDFDNSRFSVDSLRERTTIWKSIYPYMENNFVFGNGLGSYQLFKDKIYKGLSPHNSYLAILFELGFVGLALVLLFLILIAIDLIKAKNSVHDIRMNPIGLPILVSLMIFAFTDSAPFSQVVGLNSWILLGCFIKNDIEHLHAHAEAPANPEVVQGG